jgi:hypothetical protein
MLEEANGTRIVDGNKSAIATYEAPFAQSVMGAGGAGGEGQDGLLVDAGDRHSTGLRELPELDRIELDAPTSGAADVPF